MALLEADVNFKVVKQLIENIKAKAMGERSSPPSPPLNRLSRSSGRAHQNPRSHESKLRRQRAPSVILIVGLRAPAKPPPPASSRGSRNSHPSAPRLGRRLPPRRPRATQGHRREIQQPSTKARPRDAPAELSRAPAGSGRPAATCCSSTARAAPHRRPAEPAGTSRTLNPVEILFVADT
jgi:signal recognition particle subunit SRP54